MATKISQLHSKAINKLIKIFGKNIRVTYKDNSRYILPCSISDIDIELNKYNEYVGKDARAFHILIKDIKENKAPLKDFLYVEYDGKKYQVQTVEKNGLFDNKIILNCLIYKLEVNNG